MYFTTIWQILAERETKWIKVYSVGASNDEGVVKVPRLGDEALVIFKYGEVNCVLKFVRLGR